MIGDWHYDPENPWNDSFEEALLQIADSQAMVDMIKMKCREILQNPTANLRWFVEGRFVYIAKTGPVEDLRLDSLLVVYTLDEKNKLVQRVYVCRAVMAEDTPRMQSLGEFGGTLRRAIERALRNAAEGPAS